MTDMTAPIDAPTGSPADDPFGGPIGEAADGIGTMEGAGAALRAGDLTSAELVGRCLSRADALDHRLGVFISRFEEEAMAAATAADAELAAGHDRGPLHGMPIAIKDIIATDDGPTTAQSLVLDPAWGEAGDAVVIQRLRDAGAIIVGKAATLEFAIGIADPAKPFPIHRNPWDPDRWPGGSSAGTGAGVAAGLFLGGLGTDTGGSIRIPAAFCGITGLKPTYGRVPKSGCVPLGYSLDHIGPMTRSATDCAAMLSIMAGHHPSDPTSVTRPDAELAALGSLASNPTGDLSGVRIGVDRVNHVDEPNIHPDAVAVFDQAIETLTDLGATVTEVTIPHYAEGNAADILIMVAEAASYHARDFWERWDDYGFQTRRTLTWAAAYSAADYVQAQRLRRLVAQETAELLTSVDAIVHPTNLFPAPTLAETDVANWMEWPLFTSFGNTVGLPVLSLPMGYTAGMPLGLSVMCAGFDEATALRIGQAFQSATTYHRDQPPLLQELSS